MQTGASADPIIWEILYLKNHVFICILWSPLSKFILLVVSSESVVTWIHNLLDTVRFVLDMISSLSVSSVFEVPVISIVITLPGMNFLKVLWYSVK